MTTCPSCGGENREEARFCDSCGATLAAVTPSRGARKTVTVVFCDVTGSTALGERLDPESLRRVMTRYFDEMRAVLERHGGSVEKFIGDAVLAVFGVPKVHEDDALRAVRAAAEMRSALLHLNVELERGLGVSIQTRIGVNTGEIVMGDPSTGQMLVTGDAVNVAARLEQAAAPGEILIGAPTFRLVRDAVRAEAMEALSLKGKAEPVPAYRLIEAMPESQPAHRSDAPLVGRTRELRLLTDAIEHAASDRACHLVTVLGVAGVGKSRLVAEAVAALPSGTQVLTGRCLPYGDGISFWPVAEIVKQAGGIAEADTAEGARSKLAGLVRDQQDGGLIAARVAELIGLAPPGAAVEEGFWAFRKLLETLARARPLVITLDDLQWAAPSLLDLIEHVVDYSKDAPIVLLCMARPEFLEVRPTWGGGKMNTISLLLEPLSATESETMMSELVAGGELPTAVRARLTETCGGNPLFLEETLASLIEEGLLVLRDGKWESTAFDAAIQVPPTIHALLAARLDRLGREELTVIEGAAVVGQIFYRGAVSELAPEALRPDVGTYLLGLVRKDLIRPDSSIFAGEETFRFRHLLIRDAAYQAMPKQTRAELHERFAGWLERTAGDRLPEYEEIVGYHLEQAHRYVAELGPVDTRGEAVGRRAGDLLLSAGRRAVDRSDVRAAASLLSRALALLPEQAEEALAGMCDLADARGIIGDEGGHSTALYEQAASLAAISGNQRVEWYARIRLCAARYFTHPKGWAAEASQITDRAIPILEGLGDDRGLARAWQLRARIHGLSGQLSQERAAQAPWLDHARRAGDHLSMSSAIGDTWTNLRLGDLPVSAARAEFNAMLPDVPEGKAFEAEKNVFDAEMLMMEGRFDAARVAFLACKSLLLELGLFFYVLVYTADASWELDMLTGDYAAADRDARWLLDQFQRAGTIAFLPSVACMVAESSYLLGNIGDAERFAALARDMALPELEPSIKWRQVIAKVLASRGEAEAGEILAREAVALAEPTDWLNFRGDAWISLARVLQIAGQADKAVAAVDEAIALYERKENLAAAGNARKLRGEIG